MLHLLTSRLWIATVLLAGCLAGFPDRSPERTESVTAAIVGGYESGAGQDAALRIRTFPPADSGLPGLICSGYLLAPNLAVTARHCVLAIAKADLTFGCNPDGTLTDPTNPAGQSTEVLEPSEIVVYVGTELSTLTPVPVRQILIEAQSGLCESDLAFLVLQQNALDVRSPIRAGPAHVGELFSISGWGYTSDAAAAMGVSALPTTRETLDAIAVVNVGPGVVPADTFTSAGDTMCLGDSGAVALIGGIAVGVYSRIEGPCEATQSVDSYAMFGAHLALVQTAFAAAGATPVLACGQADDVCPSGLYCDPTTSVCAPKPDAGVVHTPDAGIAGDESATEGGSNGGGCRLGTEGDGMREAPAAAAASVIVLASWRRRRRARRPAK